MTAPLGDTQHGQTHAFVFSHSCPAALRTCPRAKEQTHCLGQQTLSLGRGRLEDSNQHPQETVFLQCQSTNSSTDLDFPSETEAVCAGCTLGETGSIH